MQGEVAKDIARIKKRFPGERVTVNKRRSLREIQADIDKIDRFLKDWEAK